MPQVGFYVDGRKCNSFFILISTIGTCFLFLNVDMNESLTKIDYISSSSGSEVRYDVGFCVIVRGSLI